MRSSVLGFYPCLFSVACMGAVMTFKLRPLDSYELSRLPGLSMMENNGCMYPVTDKVPHMFCGAERVKARYCKHHALKVRGAIVREMVYNPELDRNIVEV